MINALIKHKVLENQSRILTQIFSRQTVKVRVTLNLEEDAAHLAKCYINLYF